MPLYEYECPNGNKADFINTVEERRSGAPVCNCCDERMSLRISAVRGFVRFPAAGGQEYISPATGKVIGTQRARIDDLKRSGCRPYEGFDAETKQAARVRADHEKKSDAKLHDDVSRAFYQLSPDKRRHLGA